MLLSVYAGAQEKLPSITEKDYASWQSLSSFSISGNGEWVSWNITLVDGDDTLYIKNATSSKTYKYPLSSNLQFSSDSKWAASRIGVSEKQREKLVEQKKPIRYKVRLVNLESGKERIFNNIESFSFTKDAGHLVMNGYQDETSKTRDVFLHKLSAGTTKNVGNISEYSANKPGRYIAFITSTEDKKANGVELMDLNTYTTTFIESDTAIFKNLAWEKEGGSFTFFKAYSDTGFIEESHAIYSVTGIGTKPLIKKFDPASQKLLPDSVYIRDTYKPQVSDDSRIVYFGIQKWTPKIKNEKKGKEAVKLPGVDIWHWMDDPIQPRQKNTYNTDKDFTWLIAWDTYNNKVVRISDDSLRQVSITGNGYNVVVSNREPYKPAFRETYYDHYIINSLTGEKKLLMKNYTDLYGSSPAGKYILYFKEKNWWVYDIAGSKHINITSGIDVPLWNTRDDSPRDVKPPFGNGGWLKDDKALFVYDEYDIWKIDLPGGKTQKITNGRENNIRFRIARTDYEYPYLDASNDLYISAFGDLDKKSGYFRYTTKRIFEKLIYEDMAVGSLRKASESDYFVFRKESYSVSPNVFHTDASFRNPEKISETNPQQSKFAWGRSELINYKNRDGKPLQGALFYPANYEPGKKYPVIVYIYEIRSTVLHNYVTPSPRSSYNTTNYTSQGYFIFQPDIVYKTNHPGESAVDCVVPAVEELLKTGMIDEKKVGIMGHSWGAYQTSFIITQTDLFSAAVAGAPLTDMISMYNEIYWNTGNPNQNIFEVSQGRLREPWWNILDEYMKNSPMFQASGIKTPLLVAFGTSDGAVDWHQGIEMFTTMRRMEKPYIMLVYDGENHSLAKKENQIDYAKKVNEFFNHHLLGNEAPDWIIRGKKYLEKKTEEEKAAPKK